MPSRGACVPARPGQRSNDSDGPVYEKPWRLAAPDMALPPFDFFQDDPRAVADRGSPRSRGTGGACAATS